MSPQNWVLRITGTILISSIFLSIESALAQRRPIADTTLGSENSVVIPDAEGLPIRGDRIQGGAQRGGNLFHSFREFNIEAGRSVYFANPPGVENILSRVTGMGRSEILGRLGVEGNANLFLLNPNGIIFGEGASLDVAGSFVATTANAIQFGDRGFFDADEANSPALLTISPSALLFHQMTAQPIQVSSGGFIDFDDTSARLYDEGLSVAANQSLVLLGGDVILDSASLAAPGGQIELAGVAGSGSVGLIANGNALHLDISDTVPRADVSLYQSLAEVVAGNGGNIRILADDLNVLDNSEFRAGIGDGLGSVNAEAGDITLNATGAVRIVDSDLRNGLGDIFRASAKLPTLGAIGRGGDILIQADSLRLESMNLSIGTAGVGDSGNLFIRVNELVSDSSSIGGGVELGAGGQGGDIDIQAQSFFLRSGYGLFTNTLGQGNSGDISIQADSIRIRSGRISTEVFPDAIGQGGDIRLEGDSILTGGNISTSTFGQGDAGDVLIRANDSISIRGGFVQTRVESDAPGVTGSRAEGDGGDIIIRAESLSLISLAPTGGFAAVLSASTDAGGRAGNIDIRVADSLLMNGSVITANVEFQGTGRGGNIDIQANSLAMTNGSFVSSSTRGEGRGGNIGINATDFIRLSGVDTEGFTSEVATSTGSEAIAPGGNIIMTTSALRLQDGATINARTLSADQGGNIAIHARTLEATGGGQVLTTSLNEGSAGNINLNITDRIILSGSDPTYFDRLDQLGEEEVANVSPDSGLFANTTRSSTGQGGDLRINTGEMLVQNGADVTVSSTGSGNAGELNLASRDLLLDNQAAVSATAQSGEGGNLALRTQNLQLRNNSQISTTAGLAGAGGNGGNMIINADFIIAVPEENSDITANAFEGNGGDIDIETTGIYGLEYRDRPTSASDITASSELGVDGLVDINTPDVDPSRGLAELPTEVVDASRQVAQTCLPGTAVATEQSEFIISGRGGLPPTPDEIRESDTVWEDLRHSPEVVSDRRNSATISTPTSTSSVSQIVEAQGWNVDANGKVVLLAQSPTITPYSSLQSPASCQPRR
jgi:filamentous hemagglutinin family protein